MLKNHLFVVAILLVIVFLAGILRFWGITKNPPALTWDEVAWGYNAYTLGVDGRDEFGRLLPLNYLESFGDFKPPFYAYLTVIPVKIFGLNEFAVRFPNALMGVLTVLITYFLVKEIFLKPDSAREYIALFTAFLLAISPWHINLSRAAFEANVATFFIVSGVWLFLVAVRKNKWCLLLSALSFILSVYTFNTARIVAPLLIIILAIGNVKELVKNKKLVFTAIIFGFILLLPILSFLFTAQARLRFEEVNIFSDISIVQRVNRQITQDNNVWWSKLIHNRRLAYTVEYLKHYFDNLSVQFLFISGDGNPKFSTQDVGQMYLWELPFFIFGLFYLFFKREGKWWIIPCWLIIALIPAATARETPHALRIEAALPTFQVFTAVGLINILNVVFSIKYPHSVPILIGTTRGKKVLSISLKYILMICFLGIVVFNFIYYIHGYYYYYPREFSGEWQYGYKEAIAYVLANSNNYDQIFITEKLGRPYIYFLFYTKYNPVIYRKIAIIQREALGFVHVKAFDKFIFSDELILASKYYKGRNLFLDTPNQVPKTANVLKTFRLLNSSPSLVAYSI
jgi:4-amino-4-deoxy-L-arabinose transferase-like glycosyltransferase